ARAARERAPADALGRARSLADQEERRAPVALKGRVGLGNDPVVDAHATCAACCLVLGERGAGGAGGAASCRGQMNRCKRGLGRAPGMRPRLVMGLPSISLMSAVKAIGGAAAIDIPTP